MSEQLLPSKLTHFWQFFTKLNIPSPYDSAVVFLDIFSCPYKTLHTDVYRALFVIAKAWNIQVMKYYLVLKGNELLSHEGTLKTHY